MCPKSEDNGHIPISDKLEEIIYEDNDLIQNNTFVSNIPRDPSIDSLDEAAMQYNMISIAQINSEDCGVPMSIFDNVCLNSFYYIFIIILLKFCCRVIYVNHILACPTWIF